MFKLTPRITRIIDWLLYAVFSPIMRRFVVLSVVDAADAIKKTEQLRRDGFRVSLDVMVEDVGDNSLIAKVRRFYDDLLLHMHDGGTGISSSNLRRFASTRLSVFRMSRTNNLQNNCVRSCLLSLQEMRCTKSPSSKSKSTQSQPRPSSAPSSWSSVFPVNFHSSAIYCALQSPCTLGICRSSPDTTAFSVTPFGLSKAQVSTAK